MSIDHVEHSYIDRVESLVYDNSLSPPRWVTTHINSMNYQSRVQNKITNVYHATFYITYDSFSVNTSASELCPLIVHWEHLHKIM